LKEVNLGNEEKSREKEESYQEKISSSFGSICFKAWMKFHSGFFFFTGCPRSVSALKREEST
jgi:hypothetical protein